MNGSPDWLRRADMIPKIMPRTYGKVRSQTNPLDKGQGRKEVG